MTDHEFDELLHRVMIDAARVDIEEIEAENIPVLPSSHFQREMRKMLKDPLKWARIKTRPMWKTVLQKVAVIFVICSISLGSLMAVSPTVRAVVIRWVTEWYEAYIVYTYSGEEISEQLPRYTIADVPDGFCETDRIEQPSVVSVFYENQDGDVICFDYGYMQQGAMNIVTTSDNAVDITINGFSGQMFLKTETKNTITIIWNDSVHNIYFSIDSTLDKEVVLHMAEGIYLVKTTK